MELNTEKIGRLVREFLIEIGEDPTREGQLETPKRVTTNASAHANSRQAGVTHQGDRS